MKKIQINSDTLPIFTSQIDKNKDQICAIDRNVGKGALHELFCIIYSDVVHLLETTLPLFNNILLRVLFNSEISPLEISCRVFTHVHRCKFQCKFQ